MEMARMQAGDAFEDFVGPLGRPSEFVSEDIEELKKKTHLVCGRRVSALRRCIPR